MVRKLNQKTIFKELSISFLQARGGRNFGISGVARGVVVSGSTRPGAQGFEVHQHAICGHLKTYLKQKFIYTIVCLKN